MTDSLFSQATNERRPLADRLRPTHLDEVVGQQQLLASDAPLRRMVDQDRLVSSILWGPPGCGKTTLARLMAQIGDFEFESISAIFAGVADLKKLFDAARARRRDGRATLLFVDEIHRFNKAQQDAFLPFVEDGTLTFIGATTENPSFALNNAYVAKDDEHLCCCDVEELLRQEAQRLVNTTQRAAGASSGAPADSARDGASTIP